MSTLEAPGAGAVDPVADDQQAPPLPGPVRLAARRLLRAAVDRGLVGSRLRGHVVICGFPRSGSTLLQLMIDTCIEGVHSWRSEVDALWAAREAPRRSPWMVTKLPADVERVQDVRRWYATHPGKLRVVLTTRDPRAVLTSRHAGYPPERGYYVPPARWRAVDRLVQRLQDDADVTIVRYEDLVSAPDDVAARLAGAVGCQLARPFSTYHLPLQDAPLDRMTVGALNGLRPVESSRRDGWRRLEHRARLREVLTQLPELPERVVAGGWDVDDAWARQL